MDSQESSQIAALLAHRLGEHADAMQIAEAIVVVWGEIDSALAPIIGHRGVVALCKRSLYLTAMRHGCLKGVHKRVQSGIEFSELKAAIAQTDITVAVGDDLLRQLYELLASLIGDSLAERLLRSVWDNSSAGPSQGVSP
nr:hypothetical protein [uncultured Pseudomonas sp.]